MRLSTTLAAVISILTIILSGCSGSNNTTSNPEPEPPISDRYRSVVHGIFPSMANHHHADTRYLFIVDYSIPSNKDRFFIWDSEADEIVEQFWCAHGAGGYSTPQRPEFSNISGSNCSSLGWYLVDRSVGVSYQYGYKYHPVDGLDSTNSNARQRQILIHPSSFVEYDEAMQIEEPMKLDFRCAGCFTVGNSAYEIIDHYIKSRQKRILLWAIDGLD